MKMRKLIATVLSLLLVVTLLAACGGTTSSSAPASAAPASSGGASAPANEPAIKTVNLWVSGSDNIRGAYDKLVNMFNGDAAVNQGYEVVLQFIPTGGGGQTIQDKLLAAWQADQTGTDFDIVECGDEQISIFLQEGGDDMFTKLDSAKIPNLANVQARPAQGQDYFMPYRGTTVVLAYNSEAIPEPPKTVDELTQWINDNPGRFSYNSAGTGGAGDSFIRSSIYNFLPEEAFMSSDPKWKDEWDAGFEYLAEIHPFMYQSGGKVVYPNKNQGTLDLLASKEIDMCPAWADQALTGIKNGTLPESIRITQIEPSLTGAVNTLGIPTMGSNPDGAYAFMNFMLSEEAQSVLLTDIAAIPLIPLSTEDAELVKDLDVTKFRTQSIGDLGKDLNQRWDETIATLP